MCDFVLLAQAEELSVKLDPYIRTQRREKMAASILIGGLEAWLSQETLGYSFD